MEVGTKFNNIEIIERIDSGGMGEIFKAVQNVSEFFNRVVVIKKIKKKFTDNKEFIELFFQEAKVTAKLIHENIVQIYDLNKYQDEYYILMEYIDGKNLLDIGKSSFTKSKPIPIPMMLKIIEQACSGLKYAHEFSDHKGESYGIVHRDISLQNIMVTYWGTVKILDFGVMQTSDNSIDMVNKMPGKANYMSPELIIGNHIDGRSDIFSLGILFYQLLTGRKPFKDKDVNKLLEKIVTQEVAPPSSVLNTIPKEVDEIVLKMLEKNPDNRYSSAYELQKSIEKYLFDSNQVVSRHSISDYLKSLFS